MQLAVYTFWSSLATTYPIVIGSLVLRQLQQQQQQQQQQQPISPALTALLQQLNAGLSMAARRQINRMFTVAGCCFLSVWRLLTHHACLLFRCRCPVAMSYEPGDSQDSVMLVTRAIISTASGFTQFLLSPISSPYVIAAAMQQAQQPSAAQQQQQQQPGGVNTDSTTADLSIPIVALNDPIIVANQLLQQPFVELSCGILLTMLFRHALLTNMSSDRWLLTKPIWQLAALFPSQVVLIWVFCLPLFVPYIYSYVLVCYFFISYRLSNSKCSVNTAHASGKQLPKHSIHSLILLFIQRMCNNSSPHNHNKCNNFYPLQRLAQHRDWPHCHGLDIGRRK